MTGITIGLTKSTFTRQHLRTKSGQKIYRRRWSVAGNVILNRNCPHALAVPLLHLLSLLLMTLGREKEPPKTLRATPSRRGEGRQIFTRKTTSKTLPMALKIHPISVSSMAVIDTSNINATECVALTIESRSERRKQLATKTR